MKLAPIILFVYNRPEHTRITLEALSLNKEASNSILYIFCDGEKEKTSGSDISKINKVQEICLSKQWCNEVIFTKREKNFGNAKNIIDGISEVASKHDRFIVLEDDIKVSFNFLSYMNNSLERFKNQKEIFHINGFSYKSILYPFLPKYYLATFMNCWGWATWSDRWEFLQTDYKKILRILQSDKKLLKKFNYEYSFVFHTQLIHNIERSISTWDILWFSTIFLEKKLCLFPKDSLVENIGFDGSGLNCGYSDEYGYVKLDKVEVEDILGYAIKIKETKIARENIKFFFKYGHSSTILDIISKEFNRNLTRIVKRFKRIFV